eukprot:GHVU01184754.1.p1 GENE.GHVU01184754.1~~GHVU01184754.1.p1  ORF type:complete len:247 (+),score=1.64 GHVU01184754.1:305-1045(+)
MGTKTNLGDFTRKNIYVQIPPIGRQQAALLSETASQDVLSYRSGGDYCASLYLLDALMRSRSYRDVCVFHRRRWPGGGLTSIGCTAPRLLQCASSPRHQLVAVNTLSVRELIWLNARHLVRPLHTFGVHSWIFILANSTNYTKITYKNRFESVPSMRCRHAAIPQPQLIFVASHVFTIRCNDIEGDSNRSESFDCTSHRSGWAAMSGSHIGSHSDLCMELAATWRMNGRVQEDIRVAHSKAVRGRD